MQTSGGNDFKTAELEPQNGENTRRIMATRNEGLKRTPLKEKLVRLALIPRGKVSLNYGNKEQFQFQRSSPQKGQIPASHSIKCDEEICDEMGF